MLEEVIELLPFHGLMHQQVLRNGAQLLAVGSDVPVVAVLVEEEAKANEEHEDDNQ